MSEIVIHELELSEEQEELYQAFVVVQKPFISETQLQPDPKFYQKLKRYCAKHNLAIDDNYLYKVKWSALHNRVCPCHPNHRKCPCPFILTEIVQWGHCVCGIIKNGY